MAVRILADQVDFLRYMLTQVPHMSPVLQEAMGQPLPAVDDGFRPYMSEEEEELLALRLNDHISEQDLAALAEELQLPSLEADE